MTAEEKCKEFKSLSNEAKALYVCILIQSRGEGKAEGRKRLLPCVAFNQGLKMLRNANV